MRERIEMFGCTIDNLTMEETLSRIESFILSGEPHQHVAINIDKLVKAHKDPELRAIINRCALISVDGVPVIWASRMLGTPLKERVNGTDLFEALVARAVVKGWRVFFLGATDEVVRAVADRYRDEYPTLQIAGFRNGYWVPDEEGGVAEQVMRSRADILFVAISSPKKERFLSRWQTTLNTPFTMGVGGSFDVVTGKVSRAPRWMQRWGLEWFHRFLQEPRRMFRRYFVADMSFFPLLLAELYRERIRQQARPRS
jgi:N-acetylglucosaminyldiphosphoundecaprenol N-acetyl-beta-D-mannosaminyltransferase